MHHLRVLLLVLASQHILSPPTPGASEVSLKSAATTVPLSATQSADLSERLDMYFRTCHPYNQVVWGEVLPQEILTKLWTEQEHTLHAVLHISYGPDAPSHLRNTTLEVLFGFPIENGGLGPVLARDSSHLVSSYIKCPGFDALLLACHVHRLVPGIQPSARCQEWEDLEAEQTVPESDPQEPHPERPRCDA